MSFLSRIWNTVKNPAVRFVGRDLEGNRFYESRSLIDPNRPRRTIEYHDPENSWQYIGGGKRLPIQWSAWLTHTRRNPPTIQELQVDSTRMQRLAENVARIEARDRAEAEEMRRIRQEDAKRALEDAARQGERRLGEPTQQPEVVESTSRTLASEPTTQASQQAQPQGASQAAQSQQIIPIPPSAEGKPKVRPPTFLTPAAPRKPKTKKLFSLPTLDEPEPAATVSETKHPAQVKAKEEPQVAPPQKPVDPWAAVSSLTTSETESWAPKARRRG
ncbi:unnamed protein product [Cyclocybe aegerita]|uniref:NADH dehydrogenase [ubiquinone] 1 alpha subcomplex subunit n=1 Tax=Cyclocybe aegerita TaxID=1973307 RepID=A0A8S0WBW6_CYCAE|nr:unnamed protein product [Cyclocybe aegerita]